MRREKTFIQTTKEHIEEYLEDVTHKENPWLVARKGYATNEISHEMISKESIKEYFCKLNEEYKLDNIDCVKSYIQSQLNA